MTKSDVDGPLQVLPKSTSVDDLAAIKTDSDDSDAGEASMNQKAILRRKMSLARQVSLIHILLLRGCKDTVAFAVLRQGGVMWQ